MIAFTCLGFLAEWNRLGGDGQNGSDVHDAIGAYLRKIVIVDRVNSGHVPGPPLRLVWGPLPYKSSLIFYPSQIFLSWKNSYCTKAQETNLNLESLEHTRQQLQQSSNDSAQLMYPYLDDSAAAAQSALQTPLKAAPQLVAPEPGTQTITLKCTF